MGSIHRRPNPNRPLSIASPTNRTPHLPRSKVAKPQIHLTDSGSCVWRTGWVSAAGAELQALAEKLEAPVIVTRRGKGALREDHPLALCDVRGYLAKQALDAFLLLRQRAPTANV